MHLGGFLKGHAAKASAEGATLVDFEIAPFPDAEIFGDGIAIIPDDLKGVSILRDKAVAGSAHEDRQDVCLLDCEPFAANPCGREMMMEAAFQLERLLSVDPSEEADSRGVAGLEVVATLLDVLGDADLDAALSALLFSDEINRHLRPFRPDVQPSAVNSSLTSSRAVGAVKSSLTCCWRRRAMRMQAAKVQNHESSASVWPSIMAFRRSVSGG